MGGGYQFHLAYDTSQIEPAVLDDLQNGRILAGHVLELLQIREGRLVRFALAELAGWVRPADVIRFDFRILQVIPYLRDGAVRNELEYYCRYKR
ncbi:MAG TPA: hypothetical protein GX391_06405 [Firmicutes bacterium]|jgi:hypothetical protein|nr:hypothetical protein [Bacillota bacterium]HOQ23446.1 hypothetical protein [Bacillota bacterium]HPT67854.1 hypothetical protein [Bacillota bacterium]